jgi:hypothetical protein
MNRDPHPLHDALIQPAPEPFQVDPMSRRVHERDGVRVHGRALPTMATTRGDSRWKWGKPADAPKNSNAPVIFSPSDLEPQRPRESSAYGSWDELVRRLGR